MDYKSLWLKYKSENDFDAKSKLIENYVELVKIIAGRLYSSYGSNIEYDDLVGYGIFGLIDAIEKYDMSKNVKFETYAQIRIRGAIIDKLRNLDWVPRSIRQKAKLIDETYNKLEGLLGRGVKEIEVANELNITLQDLHSIMQQVNSVNIISLEEKLVEGNLNNANFSNSDMTPENILCNQEVYDNLKTGIDSLQDKERQVVSLYYYDELTYKEIGVVLGISESRVSQIHSKAIHKLKVLLM
ncbi:FliA/WhiG family RNA polymerase sigma factor [Serpentinicella alkaliphila]|uniref:RNA polymerase sigma-28 (SigD/FliA/WhiG) subunit n=1 Tax=Serpentinicella alkaliphila TaxID=1734049 RepID=A0A4R2TWL7_9FIRM|nr:FliA/WhiG family RNA polymerase sigma factor [Serpentinicella alkaliphila]QUH26305.1 FliA/WhiG family RNA polymerase sigma factor [Serpentinicella alkaliphila]TCQ05885.1 RNA polymerase sigma-28 (SigD/FliA/WhiG) subunit [Serpentinicella alkaliphila]